MNGQPNITDRFFSDLNRILCGDFTPSREDELALKDQMRKIIEKEYKQKIATQMFYDAMMRG